MQIEFYFEMQKKHFNFIHFCLSHFDKNDAALSVGKGNSSWPIFFGKKSVLIFQCRSSTLTPWRDSANPIALWRSGTISWRHSVMQRWLDKYSDAMHSDAMVLRHCVTRWLDYIFNHGYLLQYKFAQYHNCSQSRIKILQNTN